jgi:hypothetical protein
MLEASTTGHAQLKNKTINAEVNLLTEWQRDKGKVNDQIARVAGLMALIAALAFGTAPFLVRAYRDSGERLRIAQDGVKHVSAQLGGLQEARKEAKPRIDQSTMHDTVRREANQFLGHTVLVINSASAGMAFETVSADVIGGEMTLHCKADAESNLVAQNFIEQAGGGPNVESTLLATAEKNGKLARDGIGFEYVKRIQVNP